MPGVIDGQPYWEEQDSQIRGISSRSHQRAMSPYHHGNEKISTRSHHSNGYGSDHHSEPSEDGATYLLEHLATFSVGTQYGLVAPKDGLRRLLQMEKSSGIWTQKMQMRLERNWVIIIDYENGDIVERFPMSLISDPTACTSDGRRELYNNILIFIVREDPKSKNHNPSEMHIFQCAQVSAQDVVDEIKMFMSGKAKSRYKDNMRQLPPPPSNPPPDPPVNGISGISVREQVNMFNAAAAAANSNYSQHRETNYSHQRMGRSDMYVRESNDETSSTASDKYEQDVAILNHCFDDIERFIARLQHAAAAYKELERRQKSRKNKKKDMGDGMLSMRAKPPPEREFIDILQKFKLSFNLLAKLKSHIHDPNAPELVHFLFTPLALIIDAAKDSNYSSNLASRVVTPLLTRESIELLTNCCTSKETDLWHSLGEPWVIPRDQWKDYDKEYHPVFSDGWAPEYPSFDDRDPPELAAAAAPISSSYHRNEAVAEERDYHHMYPREDKSGRYDGGFYYSHEKLEKQYNHGSPSGIGDRHSHSIYESRQFEEHEEANRRDFPPDRDTRFPSAERDIRDRDVRSDFSADSIEHTSGSDPHKQFEWQQQQWLEELKSQNAKIVQVVYPRTANNDKELTVIRGEYLEVLDDSRKWWKARNMRGQIAHVPHTIITPYNANSAESEVFNNPIYATKGSPRENLSESPPLPKGNFEEMTTSSQESPSRRPAPIPTPASADWVRRERQGKKGEFRYF
ncbi:epidermal growth factor receptor kinase substrate 8-like protein 2 [Centruroides sculpturatus]|uniref:epidermal growth factor receptor kinase substrate 8-like protein 2 n=1 Tax=Centruroides sculpturatus TaxID=218467 RepID=UPI000C6D8EF9|nr:epidermal growth factor receptor kinase substrate 8-like protein 2 [Centruroides sculpturatus]